MRYGISSLDLAEQAGGWSFYYDARQTGAPGAYHGQQYDALFGGASSDFKTALLQFIETGSPGWDVGEVGVFSPNFEAEASVLSETKRAALSEALAKIK